MKELEYQVSFATPAFLGNAEQNAQWRTPPFKALLRQWWRVAYAASKGFRPDVAALRKTEGRLFGNAWLDNNFSKSLVRMRLAQWSVGKLKSWEGIEQGKVDHPEAEKSGYKVGPHAYLAYGPLDGRGGTKFGEKVNAAIQAGEQTTFSIAFPHEHALLIEHALYLMDRFGTVGGRSRNGWGSFSLLPVRGTPALVGKVPLQPWQQALELDWPHTLGSDDKALIWQTRPFDDWKAVMKQLAIIKIGLRTQKPYFELTLAALADDKATKNGINHGRPQARHWLSYPVTNHSVASWGGNARLPNSLRFKVRAAPNDPKKLVGVIFHVPCLPPAGFNPDPHVIEGIWRQVHDFLDARTQELTRIPA